ncbi:restriction endonuclease subunit S [Moraxella catarrhalis]|uniref:restriction endonuclease subunit S n=1 Tax=Moraxella catarrhalis TaxID=480 RepID=UPI00128B663E|nr:restriction endonuclease subunit S [Moraxella catarrhalis]MPW74453.1 restriction endonuclease subunit S [Moraxella catarrhalis]
MKANILKMIGQAVEWKTVDEVVSTITAPTKVKKEVYKISGKIPIIDQGIEFIAGYTDEPLTPVKSDQYVIFGDHSEHIKSVDFAFIQGADGLKILKPKYDNAKYIYHAFLNFYKKELSYKRHWTKAKETLIPIPPLSVQSQIVQILDTFTELNDQLTAELSMRQKQYQYYRDLLLSEHELAKVGFEWKTLGEVVLPTNNIKWDESDLSYRYIDLSSVDKDNNNIGETLEITSKNAPSRAQKIVKKDDVIFATTRPTQMRSALIPPNLDGQIASTGYCILRANQNEVLPKWIYYNLQIDEFKIYLQGKQSGTAYPAISDGLIKQFKIPIPPLSVQSEIVAILDTFDTLVNSICEGLPKEIQLRQKQYEYYRERLLTFDAGDGV